MRHSPLTDRGPVGVIARDILDDKEIGGTGKNGYEQDEL